MALKTAELRVLYANDPQAKKLLDMLAAGRLYPSANVDSCVIVMGGDPRHAERLCREGFPALGIAAYRPEVIKGGNTIPAKMVWEVSSEAIAAAIAGQEVKAVERFVDDTALHRNDPALPKYDVTVLLMDGSISAFQWSWGGRDIDLLALLATKDIVYRVSGQYHWLAHGHVQRITVKAAP